MRSLVFHFLALLLVTLSVNSTVADDHTNQGLPSRFSSDESYAPARKSDNPSRWETPQTNGTPMQVEHHDPSHQDRSSADKSELGVKLAPRSSRQKKDAKRVKPKTTEGALGTVLGSLAIVLGAFFLLVWFTRKALPQASTSLPKEVVEVLGKMPLSGRQYMHLVRIGNKLLLLSISPTGTETLTEITDRTEIDRITGLCQQNQSGSITQTFRAVLSQYENEPAPDSFFGDEPDENHETTTSGNSRFA